MWVVGSSVPTISMEANANKYLFKIKKKVNCLCITAVMITGLTADLEY